MKLLGKSNRSRLSICIGLFFLMFLAVGWRAFELQILQGDELKRLGERQHLKEWIVIPKRGTIADREGEPLAVSLEGQSVYVRPHRIKNPLALAPLLAETLTLTTSDVERKLGTDKSFLWLKREITPKEAEKIKSLNQTGLGLSFETIRYYPHGSLAGQVIGFAGRDSQGLEGVELHYDSDLRGESGSSLVELDALGRRVLVQGVEEISVPKGANIHLTLDTSIQHLAERELDATVRKFQAKAGTVLVVEPFRGEILAMANVPLFDPNQFAGQPSHRWRNRAVTDSYEPGSTFKTIAAAAALDQGIVGANDLFYCELGKYRFAGRIIHDTQEHGWLSFAKIVQVSSNIGAAKVAEKLGKERYDQYIRRFGFGSPTGIDLPGEAKGLVRPSSQWYPIDLATIAFGQGIAVTPMQLAMAYAAIANGGFLMRPYLVRHIVSPDGKILRRNQPHVVRRVTSERTARLLTSILRGATRENGTGANASMEEFEVAGKTGTAQKPDLVNGGYAPDKRVASFVGFAPAEDPRIVVLVMIDEPRLNVHGGVVAAPAFRNIARGALHHLGVVPDKPLIPAASTLPVQRKHDAQVRKRATALRPAATGSAVPDLTGLSLREAMMQIKGLNLQVEINGHGYVVDQSPAPGSPYHGQQTLVLNLNG